MKTILLFMLKGILFWIVLIFLISTFMAILSALKGVRGYQFYYPNGKVKNRVYLKRRKELVGLEKKYYENGNLKSKIRWKKNEINKAYFYYENGNLKAIIPYKKGKIDGNILNFYENGNLKSVISYKNGLIENLLKSYDKNGEIDEKLEKVELFYPNGNIESRRYFIMNSKITYQDGVEEEYYENGKLKSKVILINGKVNGFMESYYENGKLKSRVPFEDDEPLGIAEDYYENGNLEAKYYIDGLHREYICCWCEDGKENEVVNTYNKIMREVRRK